MPEPSKQRLSRREFGRMAATAAGLTLVPRLARSAEQTKPPADAGKQGAAPATQSAPSPEAEALAGIVKLRYGSRLDDSALKEITKALEGGLKTAEALRKVPLENADGPSFVFKAWRSEHAR